MENCKLQVENFDSSSRENLVEKVEYKKMRKRGSFLYFEDGIDIEEEAVVEVLKIPKIDVTDQK